MCDAIRAPRPRRLGHLRRGRRRPRHAPAQHHRPRRRAPADRQRGRHLQVVFNGEIYNHAELRQELVARGPPLPHPHRHRGPRPPLRGPRRADARSGSAACSPSPSGIARRRRLLLARDRFGQKPLFYTERGRTARRSPRRSRRCWPSDPSLARAVAVALDQYLTLRFVQAPDTFFERVRALPAGHFMVWETGRRPHRAVLGPELRPQVDLLRGGDARADRRAARGNGAAPPDERRAGRRVPERRARLDPDRRPTPPRCSAPSSAPSRWASRIAT